MFSRRGAKAARSGASSRGGSSRPVDGAVHLYDVPLGEGSVVVLSFDAPALVLARLTSAERAVAVLAAEGLSTRAIAARRSASLRTVSNQLTAIFEKLGVRSRVELAAKLTEVEE